MSTLTITLTGRPPVTIIEGDWPIIASGWDAESDAQANHRSEWSIRVRQHSDGRALVYATYSYTSDWQGARDYSARRGVLLPTGSDAAAICTAIEEVSRDIAAAEHHGDDASRWPTLAAECIAAMPAEAI